MATTAKKPAAKKAAPKPATPAAPVEPAAELTVGVDPEATPAEPPVTLPPVDHAPLVAPPKPPAAPAPEPEPRAGDAAVDVLASSRSFAVVCEATGKPPEAGCVFGEPVDGVVRAKCRLIETGITNSGRQVTRLLLAAGTEMNAGAAELLMSRVAELNED